MVKKDRNNEADKPLSAFIDRIEDDIAVIILDDETQLNVARHRLPEAVKEGDYLQVTFDPATGKANEFAFDDEATAAVQKRSAELQAELSPNDDADDAAPMKIQL